MLRTSLSSLRDPSTRGGRRYCRVAKGDAVVHIELVHRIDADPATSVFVGTRQARVLHFRLEDVPVLAGAGKGVKGIDLQDGDEVLGVALVRRPSDVLRVVNANDSTLSFGQMKYPPVGRAGKGDKTSRRTAFAHVIQPDPQPVDWGELAS